MRFATLLFLSAALWAQEGPGKGVNFYSIEKEIALGKALSDDVVSKTRLVDDAAVADYVNGVAQTIARGANLQFPLTVRVIDDASYDSMALPGGFLFVNTGLLGMADTEAELAAVLAHQIAHVAARHGTKQETRGQLANMASIPLIFMDAGRMGNEIRQAAQSAIPMGFLTFSRGYEHEADALGLQYLYQAGYDPAAFFTLFEKLQALEPADPSQTARSFSTHPPTQDRIERTREAIAKLTLRPDNIATTPEFDQMRQRLVR